MKDFLQSIKQCPQVKFNVGVGLFLLALALAACFPLITGMQ